MTNRRDHGWTSPRGMAGGFAMFVIEGLVVVALVALAWVVSAVVLAIL
ncbi:MAG TPA: hypothetical protein VF148_09095 [Acidimicrobiia bacterium]